MPSLRNEARFWDHTAQKYAAHSIADKAGYERTLERTRQFLKAGDHAYELGCGTGTSALRLAPSVGHFTATDFSGEMIAIAQSKAAAEGCANVTFAVEAAEKPSQAVGPVDAALAFNLLHLVAERQAVLARIHQLLRPGGLFISKTPCLSEMNPLIRLAVPVARWLGKAPYVAFFDGATLETEIANAGFEVIERARHGSGKKDFRLFLVARRV